MRARKTVGFAVAVALGVAGGSATATPAAASTECDGEYCQVDNPFVDCWYDGQWHLFRCTAGEPWCLE